MYVNWTTSSIGSRWSKALRPITSCPQLPAALGWRRITRKNADTTSVFASEPTRAGGWKSAKSSGLRFVEHAATREWHDRRWRSSGKASGAILTFLKGRSRSSAHNDRGVQPLIEPIEVECPSLIKTRDEI